jgi:hypothetical protein
MMVPAVRFRTCWINNCRCSAPARQNAIAAAKLKRIDNVQTAKTSCVWIESCTACDKKCVSDPCLVQLHILARPILPICQHLQLRQSRQLKPRATSALVSTRVSVPFSASSIMSATATCAVLSCFDPGMILLVVVSGASRFRLTTRCKTRWMPSSEPLRTTL